MKNIKQFLFILILLPSSFSFAQSGTWIWLKGSDSLSAKGNFGIKGVPSPTNEPQSRYQTAYWQDLKGNFWIFGGVNAPNDLWKYDPITNDWTWVRGNTPGPVYGTMGVPSTLNNPPKLGYGANCWTDIKGDFWLYSGYNLSTGVQNDILWRYHIATDEWTWMKGNYIVSLTANYGIKGVPVASNTPGQRNECKSAWVYDDKLWLFGGSANLGDNKNDLWYYDITTNNWVWESGTNINNDPGSFGTKGVSAATNVPPSRLSYTRWQDEKHNFYLFAGGFGTVSMRYNDVWQYNTTLKEWTWISGTNLTNDLGKSDSFCVPKINTAPASRIENQTAESINSCTKAFWNFGGFTNAGAFNDLWLFNTGNLEWTKVKGDYGTPPPSSFGTKGVPSLSNLPRGRGGAAVWSDGTGALYVFGGLVLDKSFYYGNDLWEFIPDTACFHTGLTGGVELYKPKDTLFCDGDTLKLPIPFNSTVIVEPFAGVNINYTDGKIEFFNPDSVRYRVIANSKDPNDPCKKSDTIFFTISEYLRPIADFNRMPIKAFIDNPTFNFLNLSTNAIRYEWHYDGRLITTSKDLSFRFPTIGKHCLTLLAINKCDNKDSITKCVYVFDTGSFKPQPNYTICGNDSTVISFPIGVNIDIKPNIYNSIDSINGLLVLFPPTTTTYTIKTETENPDDTTVLSETFTVTINVNPPPVSKFKIDPIYAFKSNPKFDFINESSSELTYAWFYQEKLISTEKDISRVFEDTGKYCMTLVVTNNCNQNDTSSQCCWVYAKGKLVIPNTFTPNGDGINDGFKPLLSSPYSFYSIVIMNRWGEEVFNSDSPFNTWDGTFKGQLENTGVYYYFIKVKFGDGEPEELYKGDITLIR